MEKIVENLDFSKTMPRVSLVHVKKELLVEDYGEFTFIQTCCVAEPLELTYSTSFVGNIPSYLNTLQEFLEQTSHKKHTNTEIEDVNKDSTIESADVIESSPDTLAQSNPTKGGPTAERILDIRACIVLQDYSILLQLDQHITQKAFSIFQQNIGHIPNRNRKLEPILAACLYAAAKNIPNFPLTLSEISNCTDVNPSDIVRISRGFIETSPSSPHKHEIDAKELLNRHSVKLGISSNDIEAAADIANKFLKKETVTRSNIVSISAAALYLATQINGNPKSQAELSAVTNLRSQYVQIICFLKHK
eukprot:TRINITY_DN7189_c0_g2_i6.p1 TRINITY_DN7189_c0_g2~~TRINITY_DN7189_c0_g2_i6.p1  ORF type:complete len:305 (+),score=54.86 TRINITY_DN7189_c0_g2_i6:43-957(+)